MTVAPDPNATRFVAAIPLKPRSASADWEQVQANLRRTIRALRTAVRGRPATIAVACHEEPALDAADRGVVDVLPVPFAQPEDPRAGGTDKARKRRFIGAWLREARPEASYCVLFLDADDLVHRNLVAFVVGGGAGSYVVDDGYVLEADAGVLTRRRSGFSQTCGSSFVCRFAREELPVSWDDVEAPYSLFGATPEQRGHTEYPAIAAELGRPPEPVPFPAVVYVANHRESLWVQKWGGRRRAVSPREVVLPGAARRIMAEDFSAPELASELAGPAVVAQALLRSSAARARRRLALVVASRRPSPRG